MYSASTLLPFNSDAKNAISQQRKKIPNLIPSSLQPNSNSIYRKQNAPRLEISKTPPEKLSIRVSSDVLIDESAITYAKNFETTSSVGDATAMNIQAVWSLFSRLNDQDRNDLLKGLLANCDSLQVECICQELNLKLSSTNVFVFFSF
ncbi:hypothetical protein HMI54_004368 [Coelomomyces lativittatus]|nr:hypothetical protein HMI54_004368 [Coelomomyces lativittatus]